MANIYVAATATWNGNALKKGKKDVSSFEKSIKSLGRTLGLSLGTAALINYSKNAVKAFAADEAAAKSLEVQLNNTGYAFSSPGVELYIANLQKATGVLDDQLRPALQSILTASGSLTQSQKALAIALDISAGTGKSVVEVSAAIAKGYAGQTTALSRLGAGISKTTLASGDMNKILDEASGKFSGQALARLDTYAGKMDILKTSTANASETIGKGLLDALSMIGKDQNIASLGTSMEKVATTIANVVVGLGSILGRVISIGQAIFSKLHLDKVIGFLYNNSLISKLASFGASEAAKPKSNFTYSLGTSAGTDIARATEIKRIKDANKLRAAENALLTKKTAVDALKDKFDVERIGLMAALNAATDEETKLRIRAQLAILDNNEALAKKILAEMEAAEAAKKLANAAADLEAAFRATIARLAIYDPVRNIAPGQTGGVASKFPMAYENDNSLFGPNSVGTNPTPVEVTLEIAPNAGEFGQLIYNSFLINQKNGLAQTVNGGIG